MKLKLFVAATLIATQAQAAEVTLGRGGSDNVFVWRDGDAHSEAINLISAGVHNSNPTLVMRLLSCIVPAGTKAIITDAGFASHTILITSGDDAGCRGDIAAEDVAR
ncbi:MAG: hypothetical protein ACK4ZU_02050 [Allorhizobium sp.]